MALVIGSGILIGGGIAVGSDPNYSGAVAISRANSPNVSAWAWTDTGGFGTKYADPATIPTVTNTQGIDFSPDNQALALSIDSTPQVLVYRWTGQGYGSLYSDPATAASLTIGNGIRFNRAGSAIALIGGGVSVGQGINLDIWAWNSTTGFGAKYTKASWNDTEQLQTADFSPADDVIIYGGNTTLHAAKWSNSTGYGTKYTDPTLSINSTIYSCRFSPDGKNIAVGGSSGSGVVCFNVLPWDYTTGFGTKWADPASVPTGQAARAVTWSPTNNVVFTTGSLTPFIHAWAWNNTTGFGTKYANPSVTISGGRVGLEITPTGKALAMCGSTGNLLQAIAWDDTTGFGAIYTNPTTGTGSYGQGVSFSK